MTRTAIITGASSGIGRATAIVLAQQGYDVGLTWNTDETGINATIAEVEAANRHYAVRHVDPDPGDGVRMVDELADELGHLDVFVDNAGTGASTPFLEHTLEEGRHVIDVDLTAAFLCMQTAARRLVAQGDPGRIIAVTSVHEHVPKSGSSAYCAAKGGLGLLVKVSALELAEHGITVNAVAPGEIATKLTGQQDQDPTRNETTPACRRTGPGMPRRSHTPLPTSPHRWRRTPPARRRPSTAG
jgi:NAD(P)-dependent dehydrogenase (short-subunit alcohol dehydrogenase family)